MKVEFLETFGNDLMVVNAARVSYGKKKEVFDLNDEKLIKYLVSHKHTSVFRHPQLQFRIVCPIYVERQLFKHQVGMSANSISGRYVDFSDTYTKIKTWRKQSKDSKQGSDGSLCLVSQEICNIIQDETIQFCKDQYDRLIKLGVSKEQARSVLPLNLNTQFIWTGSLLSFIHLFKLRLKNDAQQETREVVELMLQQVKENGSFEQSLKAFEL
jgi:thymidylate synthase (FAD)